MIAMMSCPVEEVLPVHRSGCWQRCLVALGKDVPLAYYRSEQQSAGQSGPLAVEGRQSRILGLSHGI